MSKQSKRAIMRGGNRKQSSMQLPLGKAFKSLRLGKRWTQPELAEITGIPQGYISQLENGKLFPGDAHIGLLIKAFGKTAEEVWKLAEKCANINLDVNDSRNEEKNRLLSCLSHDKFDHSFEQLQAYEAAASDKSTRDKLAKIVDRLSVDRKGSITREDVSEFKNVATSLHLPPYCQQVFDCFHEHLESLITDEPIGVTSGGSPSPR